MTLSLAELKTVLAPERLQKISCRDVMDALVDGKTYQELLEIPDQWMQQFYDIALDYFTEKRYEEASDCFFVLATLSPLESNLWNHCGHCEQALGRNDEALEAFSMAMLCDADDPFPHFYSAEIYVDQKQLHQAKDCLHVCQMLVNEHPKFAPLNEHIQKLSNRIKKQ